MRKYERFCAFVDKEIHFNRKKNNENQKYSERSFNSFEKY